MGWLEKMIEASRAEVNSWPEWMRRAAHFEGTEGAAVIPPARPTPRLNPEPAEFHDDEEEENESPPLVGTIYTLSDRRKRKRRKNRDKKKRTKRNKKRTPKIRIGFQPPWNAYERR